MRILYRSTAVFSFLLLCLFTQAQNNTPYNIPKPLGRVNDYEHLLTAQQHHRLDSIIRAYEQQTAVQIAIVTIDTGMVAPDNFVDYTLAIANTWGVGEAETDMGILIGVSKGYRTLRIQNGLGVEKLITDEETKQVIDRLMIPEFKNGNYYAGIHNGMQGLMQLLNERIK